MFWVEGIKFKICQQNLLDGKDKVQNLLDGKDKLQNLLDGEDKVQNLSAKCLGSKR